MTQHLTAFEFIGATDGPQLVRLRRVTGEVIGQFAFVQWIGVDLRAVIQDGVTFDRREDLIIEGEGLGHPYWNDDQPSWLTVFDSRTEAQRIGTILAAVRREMNRARIVSVP